MVLPDLAVDFLHGALPLPNHLPLLVELAQLFGIELLLLLPFVLPAQNLHLLLGTEHVQVVVFLLADPAGNGILDLLHVVGRLVRGYCIPLCSVVQLLLLLELLVLHLVLHLQSDESCVLCGYSALLLEFEA